MKYDTMKMTAVIIIPLLWEGLCTKCEGVAVLYVWLTDAVTRGDKCCCCSVRVVDKERKL